MSDDKKKNITSSDDENLFDLVESLTEEPDNADISTEYNDVSNIPREQKDELSDEEFAEFDSALYDNISMILGDHDEAAAANEAAEEDESTASVSEKKEDNEDFEAEESHEDEDDIMEDINAALALQVNYELEKEPEDKGGSKKWLLSLIPFAGVLLMFLKYRKNTPKWFMVLRTAVFMIIFSFTVAVAASGGKVVYNLIGWYFEARTQNGTQPTSAEQLTTIPTGAEQITPGEITPGVNDSTAQTSPTPTNIPREEDYIINILLLGEEAIDMGGSRGNTDVIIIATMDAKEGTVKLTSLMRDMLVAVPGHSDNRINSVYQLGGIDLLYDTIEMNFEIKLDGYMLVGFESFEKIIDSMNGVTISLTKEEADYLNTTNYISNPIYRTVEPGSNLMNGNQALGYARIRKVATGENIYADFGRTSRHRILLNAIFEKVKTLNLFQLTSLANELLPLVTTDITGEQISDYLETAVNNKITTFVQMRIPINGSYSDTVYNGMTDLIQVNFPENIKALHVFIFGDYKD